MWTSLPWQVPGDYDPACPLCVVGEKQMSNMSRKALRAEAELKAKYHEISRNRVIDSYLDDDFDNQNDAKREGKTPKTEVSSSFTSSSMKPFLRWHFLLGSKWSGSGTDMILSGKRASRPGIGETDFTSTGFPGSAGDMITM